eukprot:7021499-Pyramimonas_sp.AAC.1
MKRKLSSRHPRGHLLSPTQMYSPHSQRHVMDDATRERRYIAASIQPRFVFRANLDKRSYVDLGNKNVQDAVMHYLDVCFVNVVMLQPNCRTTGLPSYFNSQVNYDSWYEHHTEDLPHIKFRGQVAIHEKDLRRFYLREQPVRTWVDQIPPWTTVAFARVLAR